MKNISKLEYMNEKVVQLVTCSMGNTERRKRSAAEYSSDNENTGSRFNWPITMMDLHLIIPARSPMYYKWLLELVYEKRFVLILK